MTDASNTRTQQPNSTLHRSGHDRFFAGVAGGLGEHLGINPWWFRWAFVLLALFAGVGVLVYLLAWIVIPGPDEDDPIVSRWIEGVDWSDGGAVFGIVLVGVAGVLLATRVVNISGVLILSAVLFIVGLLLYRGDLKVPERAAPPTPSGSPEDAPDAAAAVGLVDEMEPDGSATDEIPSPPLPPRTQKPPRPPRERSMLGRLTIAIGIIVLASMALAEASGLAVDIEPFHYFAAIIAVLGVGLLIGAWAGRARWLIIIGVIVTPMLWLSMLLPMSLDFSIGEFTYTPLTVEEVASPYKQGVGRLVIDLNGLTPDELAEVGTVEASLGLGELLIALPDDVAVVVRATVGAGEVTGPFRSVSGLGIDVVREIGPELPLSEPPVLVLDLEVGAGEISISGPAGSSSDKGIIILEGGNS